MNRRDGASGENREIKRPETASQEYRGGSSSSQGYYGQRGNGPQGYYGQGGNGPQGYYGQGGNGPQGYYGQGGNSSQGYYGQGGNSSQGYYGQGGNGSQGYYGQSYYQQSGNAPRGRYQGNGSGDPYQGGNGYRGNGPQGGQMKKPYKKKKKRKIRFIFELLLLLILAIGLFVFFRLGRMEHLNLKNILVNSGVSESGYQNFVIYGVDSREGNLTQDSHSDTIIICSLNKKTKEIKMVSVYRDTYLDNTNGEYRKATECYFFGGPERSINMLNKNLDLDIKDYVAVNFNAVVEAVDLIGGIDMEITDEELQWLNGYCVENSQVTGVSYTPLSSAGYQHLDGIQTLAYCRIRYTAGYDFKRTERQRMVLGKIFEKAQSQGIPTLLSMVDTMLPSISTSMSTPEIIGLVSGMGGYQIGETVGFPFDQTPADLAAGDCVVPVNLANNVVKLHSFLYGQDGYVPSQEVQNISNEIINSTGIQ